MDVNGTHFHLVTTRADWFGPGGATPEPAASPPAWSEAEDLGDWDRVDFDETSQTLTLKRLTNFFPRGRRDAALTPDARRGAAVDRFGNWYWIAHDRQRVYWRPAGGGRSRVYWDQAPPAADPQPGDFQSCNPPPPPAAELAGLAVTDRHYLVVGNVTAGGLFVFDLHAGGPPLALSPFPPGERVEPFDLAPAPGGGVWVLDRNHRTYWGLDRRFRPVIDPALPPPAAAPAAEPDFAAADGSDLPHPRPPTAVPFPVAAADPVAIEALPDGGVLVLDTPPAVAPAEAAASVVLYYRLSQLVAAVPLGGVEAVVEGAGDAAADDSAAPSLRPVAGHDFAFLPRPTETDPAAGVLFVIERDGNQVIAFAPPAAEPAAPGVDATWSPLPDYLPLQYFGGRALARRGERLFYDVVGGDPARDPGVRWVELQTIDHPGYAREADLLLRPPRPIRPGDVEADADPFDRTGPVGDDETPVQAFDGKGPDCVWHRFLLDGCLPPGTGVEVWARAHDRPDLLATLPFLRQPDLYRRGSAGGGDTGAEIPYYRPFGSGPLPAAKGTWELLFQDVRGRYLQLRLVLRGNGRVSPELRALRIYYPRFSYPQRYLPRVYGEDPTSASFTERLLANMEGFYTLLEGQIELVPSLFDARTAVPEALTWLASWLGLALDPIWDTLQQRRLADPGLMGRAEAIDAGGMAALTLSSCQPAPSGVADVGRATSDAATGPGRVIADRRRLLIRFAPRLYERRGTVDGIRLALHLLLDPCLETTLARLKRAAVWQDKSLRAELNALGLPYPTPTTSDADLEDLLYELLLTPKRPSKVRIIEHFLTRGGEGALLGDPTAGGPAAGTPPADPTAAFAAAAAAAAHRFSVLVPAGLSDAEEAMIGRIVAMEKPAHTGFDVRRYWDAFRIGEARLGIDTTLGEESRFAPIVLGRDYLGDGFLAPAPPADAKDRMVSDRDRLGCGKGL